MIQLLQKCKEQGPYHNKVTKNFIICPKCNSEIQYILSPPILCCRCQFSLPKIANYLQSKFVKLSYHKLEELGHAPKG